MPPCASVNQSSASVLMLKKGRTMRAAKLIQKQRKVSKLGSRSWQKCHTIIHNVASMSTLPSDLQQRVAELNASLQAGVQVSKDVVPQLDDILRQINDALQANNKAAQANMKFAKQEVAKAQARLLQFRKGPLATYSQVTRSVSQAEGHVQMQRLLQRVEQCKRTVPELQREVTFLGEERSQLSQEQTKQKVTVVLKNARNIGEDLAEDLVALDTLTGLLPEDRRSRKAAITRINSLLDDVDACKSTLATFSELACARKHPPNLDDELLGDSMALEERTDQQAGIRSLLDEVEACLAEVGVTSCHDNEHSHPPTRSVSQAEAHAQIQNVLLRIEQCKLAVPQLAREVQCLEEDSGKIAQEQMKQKVSVALKQARNLSEDLVESLLALDKLIGLLPQDRSNRKVAVTDINSLLDAVDVCKTTIAKVQKAILEA